ncbi:MAG TPA: glutamate racemase [Actinomycetota bacterium]|nr:glutamate racemase [Actinomycetota bacterium]
MVVESARSDQPIGMFDSGVGGLTVARAVIDVLPHEDVIYFGDTARCPYGPRPVEEVRRFALEIMDALVREQVKLLVVACNAAASAALIEAQQRYEIPVLSVIEPGVRAATAASRNGRIGVIGTKVTISSRSYDDAVRRHNPGVTLVSQACPRFVEFVEKGDSTSDELVAAAEAYLAPLRASGVDTVILGCTHYPLLSGVIRYVLGDDVVLISSAEVTAEEVYVKLKDAGLLHAGELPGVHRFIASGGETLLGDLASRLLGSAFTEVEQRPWLHEPARRS